MEHRPKQGVIGTGAPLDGMLPEVLLEMAAAARAEARAEIDQSPSRILLRAGLPRGAAGAEQVWSFEIMGDDDPPTETPGHLLVETDEGETHVSCRVLATGTGTILLGVRADLGASVSSAALSLDAGFVTVRLAERLEAQAEAGVTDPTLVLGLLQPDPVGSAPAPGPGADGDGSAPAPGLAADGDEQELAVARAVEPGLRFTWGPPGTGKTGVLARAVARAARRGDRVLVLAHANAAVDVAALRIAEEMVDSSSPGDLLRVGTPHSPELIRRHEVLPDAIVGQQHPDLVGRRSGLTEARHELSDRARRGARSHGSEPGLRDPESPDASLGARLEAIRTELADLDDQLATARRDLISQARVLVTTIAKAVVDDQVWDWPADVVVVDEASMAPYPALVGLAAQAPATLSCVGDFRQLPPVVISREARVQRLFGVDVFGHAEVTAAVEARRPDHRLTVLRVQHRMGEQICRTVSGFAYDGLLSTSRPARNRAIRLARRWPGADNEIVVVDTTDLGAIATSPSDPADRSRYGLMSAAVALGAACRMSADGAKVAILSPYRAQVDIFRAAVADHDEADLAVSTIHRFQGSEQDAVVVDLVDAPGVDGASRLTGTDADLSRRLLNVAVSRARGKLVLLAHLDFLERLHPRSSRSRGLIQAATNAGAEVVSGQALVADLMARPEGAGSPDAGSAARLVETDAGPAGLVRWFDDGPAARSWLEGRGLSGDSFVAQGPVALGGAGGQAVGPRLVLVGSGTSATPAAVVESEALVTTMRRLRP